MMTLIVRAARPLLTRIDPERAHELTMRALEAGVYPRPSGPGDPRLNQTIWGLEFANPLGLAAGFDKDARVPNEMMGMGLGFAEVGTVTPLPQPGNPRPRIFRLPADRALINRLGFNNAGHAAAHARLEKLQRAGPVGVNIGANRESDDRVADYVAGIEVFNDVADFFTVNISSPNTPGLRDLQAPDALDGLLTAIRAKQADLVAAGRPKRPLTVKLAPGLTDDDLPDIIACMMAHDVDGITVSNTTNMRAGLKDHRRARQAGGLSGAPLFKLSTRLLARVHRQTEGKIPLIGVGGIESGAHAIEKIAAGASLLQFYTALIFHGPKLIGDIKRAIAARLEAEGSDTIADLVGTRAEIWSKTSPLA